MSNVKPKRVNWKSKEACLVRPRLSENNTLSANMIIQESMANSRKSHTLSVRITVILAKRDKCAQHEGCMKTKLIHTYKRRRENKGETHRNFKRIQFFIEGKD